MALAIATARLRLNLQSTEALLALIEGMSPTDRAEVSSEWLAKMRKAEPSAWTHGFEMVDATTGTVVGSCGFKGPPDPDGTVEIAYGVHPDQRGRGYAKESAAALVEFAFGAGARLVRAHTRPHNDASARVLVACGFERIGEVVDAEDGLVWRWETRPGSATKVAAGQPAGWNLSLKREAPENREPPAEPIFTAVRRSDPEMATAHRQALATIQHFMTHVVRSGDHVCCAKLRFRDPDLSEQLGEDRFLFLWLNDVQYRSEERCFSGTFFELPRELAKWHQVGERLAFESEDVFDWMVQERGTIHGGYTLRVTRQRLPEAERANYDRHVGAISWHPLPP